MNKIEFKVENKTQNTEYQAFYNKTSWDLYIQIMECGVF